MGKRMCPKWAIKKIKCECGTLFYPVLIGSSNKVTTQCLTCKPLISEKKK